MAQCNVHVAGQAPWDELLCPPPLCLVALAMDLDFWGYCGILSLGHFAFFGLALHDWHVDHVRRTEASLVGGALVNAAAAAAPTELDGTPSRWQIFGVVGGDSFFHWMWVLRCQT